MTLFLVPATVDPNMDNWAQIFSEALRLVSQFQTLGVLAGSSAAIILLMQIFKTSLVGRWVDNKHPAVRRGVLVLLGQISGVLMMVLGGMSWTDAVVAGLITSGGASVIYEAFKPFAKTQKQPPTN